MQLGLPFGYLNSSWPHAFHSQSSLTIASRFSKNMLVLLVRGAMGQVAAMPVCCIHCPGLSSPPLWFHFQHLANVPPASREVLSTLVPATYVGDLCWLSAFWFWPGPKQAGCWRLPGEWSSKWGLPLFCFSSKYMYINSDQCRSEEWQLGEALKEKWWWDEPCRFLKAGVFQRLW